MKISLNTDKFPLSRNDGGEVLAGHASIIFTTPPGYRRETPPQNEEGKFCQAFSSGKMPDTGFPSLT
jgi:hypothetical protein